MSEPITIPELPWGTVRHQALGVHADSDDAGLYPDLFLIAGLRVTFTPSVKAIVWTGGASPVTHIPARVEGEYDATGRLRLVLPNRDLSVSEDIRLFATTGPDIQPSGWWWQAEWANTALPMGAFQLDPAGEIDLSSVVLSSVKPGTPGLFIDLLRISDDAVAAAAASSASAVDAAAIRDDVALIAGLTGEDAAVAFLLDTSTQTRASAKTVMDSLSVTYGANHGIVADGVTWNSIAMNALIQTVSTSGGGHIVLPAGNIVLEDYLIPANNVTLSGAGIASTILKPHKSAAHWSNQGGQTNPITNFHMRNLTIDGTLQTAGYKGVSMQYLVQCSFVDMEIKNTQFTGLGIDFLVDCIVDRVWVRNCGLGNDGTQPGGNGIGIGIGGFATQEESVTVSNCHVYDIKRSGIMVEKSGYAAVKGIKIIGNYVTRCGDVGIQDCGVSGGIIANNVSNRNVGHGFASSRATIGVSGPGYQGIMANNQAFKNGKDGFLIDGTGTAMNGPGYLLSGNMSVSNTGHGFNIIATDSDVAAIQLTGNQAHRNVLCGLRVRSSNPTVGKIQYLTVAGNVFMGNGFDGSVSNSNILVDADIEQSSIVNNMCITLLSGSTPFPARSIQFMGGGRTYAGVSVQGNRVPASTGVAWSVGGTWTASRFIDNEGYNNTAPAVIAVAGNPFVHTAGARPERLYLASGVGVVTSKGGVAIANGTDRQFDLAPNESVSIAYDYSGSIKPVVAREYR